MYTYVYTNTHTKRHMDKTGGKSERETTRAIEEKKREKSAYVNERFIFKTPKDSSIERNACIDLYI